MKFEEFFLKHNGPDSPSSAFTTRQHDCHSALPEEVREAAIRGWLIFPVPQLAKLTGNPDLLIGEATSEISRLEELAAEYDPLWGWRMAVSPSLCILEVDGPQGRSVFAALIQDEEECLTLQASRGDTAWAFFRFPKGLVLRSQARTLAPGVRILADGDSCVIAPFCNSSWAETEAVPYALRELAFEPPDTIPTKQRLCLRSRA
jgi:hypothetical protein